MQRDVSQLTRQRFDLLVIGGGIYGLTIACDGAGRGLSVALIDRSDFGSGASFNHLRTIHGGLRYLQTLDIARARESLRERRTLARIAPAALRPMPFLLPLGRSLMRGTLVMRAGFALDAFLSKARNVDVQASLKLPRGGVLTAKEALEQCPMLGKQMLTGAAVWYDYVTTEADRLTLAWAVSAAAKGAVLANYVTAKSLLVEFGRVQGVQAADVLVGGDIQIRSEVVVNATGAAMPHLGAEAHRVNAPPILAMNLVTNRPAGDLAVGARSATGRTLFLVPWRGRALFGTWESTAPESISDRGPARHAEVLRFLDEINQAFPLVHLMLDDVTMVHHGVVPAEVSGGTVRLAAHERIEDLSSAGLSGLITVAGTKYTTARAVAERTVDLVLRKLGRPATNCRTATEPLPVIVDDLKSDAALVRAVREEMAVTLADVVIRRTPIGALGCPEDAELTHAAEIVGRLLGWDENVRRAQIQSVRAFYVPA